VDTGVGVAADDLARIFEPFQQLAQPGRHVEGTGLGLAISRRLIALFGGKLDVVSQPGEGSTFTVEVVVGVAESGALARPGRASPGISGYIGRRRRVLVVDDKDDNRAILCHLLASIGIDVLEAEHGRQAVQLAQLERPDAVMMDLVMPVMDGFEAIRQLRADHTLGDLRIIALSASAFDATRAQSVAAGCDAFLAKPLRFDEVLQVLGRELDLQWTYGASDPSALAADLPVASGDGDARLALPLARELHELALAGDVRALERRLGDLRTAGAAPPLLLDRLDALTRSFDMRGLRNLLRPQAGVAP
jgi:CheY-like chemotaxis protein